MSAFVQDGAVSLGLTGPRAGDSLALRTPNGHVVVVALNPFGDEPELRLALGDLVHSLPPAPLSFNSPEFG